MKRMGIKVVMIGVLLVVFSVQSMARLWRPRKMLPSGQKPIVFASTGQNNVFGTKKTFMQGLWENIPSLKSMSYSYLFEKVEDRLPALSVSPIGVSRMTFSAITGIPMFVMDFNAWKYFGKKLFYSIMGKKLSFNQVYQKSLLRLKQSDKDKLFFRLEKLAYLSISEKKTKQYEYEVEARMGKQSQAEAWLFGSTYRDAIHDAETMDDLALLYEAASNWLRLRIESGLYDDLANLNTEFNRIDQQAEKIVNKYDEQSIPIVKKYVQDMRQDFYDTFAQWFQERQK